MESVTQVQCESCRDYGPQSEMRVKGVRLDGSTRWRHRVNQGCQRRVQLTEEMAVLDVRSEDFDQAFHDEGLGYNLTALWRAAGRPVNKQVKFWLETEEGRAWKNVIPDNVLDVPGRAGGTWRDDIQAALQYAAYLDPGLREDIYDRYVQHKLERATSQPTTDIVVYAEVNQRSHDRTYRKLEEIQGDLRGATLYKDRVLVIRGSVYFTRLWPELSIEAVIQLIDIPFAAEMWRKGYRLYSIGKTGKKTEARLDNYAKKMRMRSPIPIAELHVDDPDEAERLLKRLRPNDAMQADGCSEQFWCKPSIEERVRRSWLKTPTIAVADLAIRMRGWEVGSPVVVEQHSF